MSKNELLPCPFCGKDDELRITHIYEGEDYIGCDRCKYDGVHITMWNSRVYQKYVLKAVERDKPKKPDLKTENKMSFFVCESCGNKVFKGMNVCDECGQRLNWED